MISLDEARRFVLGSCEPLPPRSVPLDDALGCVVAAPLVAGEAIPPFANSQMDGYALRSEDSKAAPVSLKVVGSVMAGQVLGSAISAGQAARIMTGAPLPPGADAVEMLEEVEMGEGASSVTIKRVLQAGNFVRSPGHDVAVGDVIAELGSVLSPARIGVLAGQGIANALVHPRPRVGVLSTGDELVADFAPLSPGKIRDSNRHALMALVRKEGWDCLDLGIVGDDESALAEVLETGAKYCDAILTSGGVSVGDLDIVRVVLEKLSGGTMRWMQVAIRPAKPFAFGLLEGSRTPVFGLPGNPVSAIVSFELFARPALRLLAGHAELYRPVVRARAETDFLRRSDGKLHLLRADLTLDRDGSWRVRAMRGQESHQLHAMAEANALALLPDGEGVRCGELVDVLVIEPDRLSQVGGAPR
jgi:molybdenum cofactor synthesis domain-containing protein